MRIIADAICGWLREPISECYSILLHHLETYQRALAHKVDGIEFRHRLEQCDGLTQTCAGASNAEGHGSAIAHVWIVGFGQQRDDRRTLLGRAVETESKVWQLKD